MLSHLIRFAIRFSGLVIAMAVVLMVYGAYLFKGAGLDIFPEFGPKQVIIQTEAQGLSAEQVEVLVSQQIETAVSGLMGLKTLRSQSIQGLSIVTATFSDQTDIYKNRQLVNERLVRLSTSLPPGIGVPVAVPLSSSSATVLTIGLHSESKNLMELRTLADWTLVPRLLSISGVADVNVFGGEVQQLQVQIRPQVLQRFDLSVDDVVEATQKAAYLSGAGFIENSNQRFTLQITGQPNSPESYRDVIIKYHQGSQVTLGDVAEISWGPEPAISAAQIQGKQGVVMMIIGQYGANTLSVSKQVESVLEEFDALFKQQEIVFHSHLFRPADYIETSVANLSGHLLVGGVFVLLVLYFFLFNARTALIAALAIPVSLTIAVIVLLQAGVNLNIMVLGGLAIALGEVVDDAIIDTENIFRRLRENRSKASPDPVEKVIYRASLEVRGSVVYASFIVALVFVPLLTLSGVAGRLFAPLGFSYILAILMSLLVALTLTPALCHLLLAGSVQHEEDAPIINWLKPKYEASLKWVVENLRPVLIGTACLGGVGFMGFLQLDHKFLPELREGHFILHTASVPGTSLSESIRVGSLITEQVMSISGVESVSQWAGRAERGADTYGSHYSEYEVRLKSLSGGEQQQVLDQIREVLDAFPGILYEANTFLTERVDETISGYTAPVVINIYGHDFHQLDQKAAEVVEVLQALPGATDIQVRSPPATSMLQVELLPDLMRFRGISPSQVMQVLQTAYEGKIVAKTLEGNRIFNVAVVLAEDLRNQVESLEVLPFLNADGQRITLGQIAEIHQVDGRYNILHQGAQRVQTVTCKVEGEDMDTFVKTIRHRLLDEMSWVEGVYPEFAGAALEQAQARESLIVHALLAGAGVLLLVYMALNSFRQLMLTLLNLPFALIGGVAVVVLGNATLSIGSFVGFITLFGITVRNSIMLISHYQHLVDQENQPWNLVTVIRGAQERLPSILMTALVTALAMLPIALNSDNPGREIMGPMAAIIVGGLVSSTLLNLLVLPAILLKYGKILKRSNFWESA